MRKDKGLNGDLDRLPLLTWLMFLKFLDDHEADAESRAKLERKKYRPTIDPPYRWRDWAANDASPATSSSSSSPHEETDAAGRQEGRGPDSLPPRRSPAAPTPRRVVVGRVFDGVTNRMESGYLLRDDRRTRSTASTSTRPTRSTPSATSTSRCSRRCATRPATRASSTRRGRSSGSWCRPRTRGSARRSSTRPAAPAGSWSRRIAHLKAQAKTAEHLDTLQKRSIFGQEAKPLPYLLCQMNLLLHGLDAPEIKKGNSLDVKLTDIGDADRVDVILTNPPFGGEEEKRHPEQFPGRQADGRDGAAVPAAHHAAAAEDAEAGPGRGGRAERDAVRRRRVRRGSRRNC